MMIYLSRNYTEFGPFTNAELLDFQKRGILREGDHIRAHGENAWRSLKDWIALASDEVAVGNSHTAAASKPLAKKASKKAAKKAAKKKSISAAA